MLVPEWHLRIMTQNDQIMLKLGGIARGYPRAIDAHCHLHDPRLAEHARAVLRRAAKLNVSHVVSCACFEDDWLRLEEFMSSAEYLGHQHASCDGEESPGVRVIPSFGLHPWWADAASAAYLAKLRDQLVKYPQAALGEIGLCKSARGKLVDRSVQERVFQDQLRMATELQRPCVIHCVGAYGKVLEILQSEQKSRGLPPVLVLHSYSGATDMVPTFLKLEQTKHRSARIFFSLNAKQFAMAAERNRSKYTDLCTKVPVESLLLETDAPDQCPSADRVREIFDQFSHTEGERDSGLNEPALVQLALSKAAIVRQMPVDELAAIVYANSMEAFRVETSSN